MAIKAVFFDMDGVLVDAKEWHYEALNRALAEKGFSVISRQQHLLEYEGLPTRDKLKKHPQTKLLQAAEHQAINERKQELTMEVIKKCCRPNPAILQLIKFLKKRGIRIACCSNSIKSTIELMLELSGVLAEMEFIISNEDVTLAKPNPEMYLEAISRMGLLATECLICEDHMRGITAALHSGSYVLEIGTTDDTNTANIEQAIYKIENESLPEQLIRPKVRTAHIRDMAKGWFVGDFYPAILKTQTFEAAVKEYKKGEKEDTHLHRVATEITVIVRGKVIMCGRVIKEGEMILMEPGEATSFEALEDTITFVVKTPSVKGDKYQA